MPQPLAATTSQRISNQLLGLKGLHSEIKNIRIYLQQVVDNRLPVNHQARGGARCPNAVKATAPATGRPGWDPAVPCNVFGGTAACPCGECRSPWPPREDRGLVSLAGGHSPGDWEGTQPQPRRLGGRGGEDRQLVSAGTTRQATRRLPPPRRLGGRGGTQPQPRRLGGRGMFKKLNAREKIVGWYHTAGHTATGRSVWDPATAPATGRPGWDPATAPATGRPGRPREDRGLVSHGRPHGDWEVGVGPSHRPGDWEAGVEKIFGWYHTGPKLQQNDIQINKVVRNYCPNSVLVIIDAEPKALGLPTEAYRSVEEVHDDGHQGHHRRHPLAEDQQPAARTQETDTTSTEWESAPTR
jgi:proteasome lid subunit RPN8/RPN11